MRVYKIVYMRVTDNWRQFKYTFLVDPTSEILFFTQEKRNFCPTDSLSYFCPLSDVFGALNKTNAEVSCIFFYRATLLEDLSTLQRKRRYLSPVPSRQSPAQTRPWLLRLLWERGAALLKRFVREYQEL